MPNYYPVYLKLSGRRCVIFGGGPISEGKLSKLMDTGAQVAIISPQVTPVIRALAHGGSLEWTPREYQQGDLEGAFLGIAATDNRSVNQEIAQEAERRGVVLNVVDDPELCGFIAPSVVQRGPVTVAISTGGASPALARKLRETLANTQALEWADLANVLSRARKQVKHQGIAVDAQRWQCCLTDDLLHLAQSGREDEALDQFLGSLLDRNTPWLCPDLDQCQSKGCLTQVSEPAAAAKA